MKYKNYDSGSLKHFWISNTIRICRTWQISDLLKLCSGNTGANTAAVKVSTESSQQEGPGLIPGWGRAFQ